MTQAYKMVIHGKCWKRRCKEARLPSEASSPGVRLIGQP